MTPRPALAPLVVAGLMTAAFAPAPEAPDAKAAQACFWERRIENFASDDDRYVNVLVGTKDVYRFEFLGRCSDIDYARSISVRSRGRNFICPGADAVVTVPTDLGPLRCTVRSIRKLSEAEITALPKGARP
jgi:hypothetical protein